MTETLQYASKTLDEIEADEFLRECVKVEQVEGPNGPELAIKIAVQGEIRVARELVDDPALTVASVASVVAMVQERFDFDLNVDVWPTLQTRLLQALQSSAENKGNPAEPR